MSSKKTEVKLAEKRQELADQMDAVSENMALARQSATLIETLRALWLIELALDDHEVIMAGCLLGGRRNDQGFDALDVHERAGLMLKNLYSAVAAGDEQLKIERPPRSYDVESQEDDFVDVEDDDDLEVDEKPEVERDPAFEEKLIKVMSMAGTKKDGDAAIWEVEQIVYGLQKVLPNLTDSEVFFALSAMAGDGIVIFLDKGDTFDLAKARFVLADQYAAKQEERRPLDERIVEQLKSAP